MSHLPQFGAGASENAPKHLPASDLPSIPSSLPPPKKRHWLRRTLQVALLSTTALVGAGLYAVRDQLDLIRFAMDQVFALPHNKPGPVSSSNGWPSNVVVYSSSGQHQVSLTHKSRASSYYSEALIAHLKRPEIRTLSAAQAALVKDGYPSESMFFSHQQFPLATPMPLAGWDKTDPTPKRYALFLSTEEFAKDSRWFADAFTQIFGLPKTQVTEDMTATAPRITQAIERLGKQIQSSGQSNQPVEVLLYLSSHGSNQNLIRYYSLWGKEGDAEGVLQLDNDTTLREPTLKRLLAKTFPNPNVKVFVVIDACHSGAWVTQNETERSRGSMGHQG